MLESSNVNSRVNGDVLSKQQYVHKVTSDNKHKTDRKFVMFIVITIVMDSTRKTVLAAFCPYKAGQVLSLIQSDRQTQGLKL